MLRMGKTFLLWSSAGVVANWNWL